MWCNARLYRKLNSLVGCTNGRPRDIREKNVAIRSEI